jgi:transglutaminase-like putative cysteine protease
VSEPAAKTEAKPDAKVIARPPGPRAPEPRASELAPTDPEQQPEPWLATLLRLGVYALTAFALTWTLAVWEGVAGATLGAALASLAGRALSASRVRTPVILGSAASMLVVGIFASNLIVGSALFAQLVGPANTLRAGDLFAFGGSAFAIGLVTRTLSSRRRSFAVLEAILIAVAFAQLVVAHRHGAIHRPFWLADFMFERGSDPSLALIALGGVAAVVVGLLFFNERSVMRSALHLGAAFLLLLLTLVAAQQVGVPEPEISDMLRPSNGSGGGEGGGSSSDGPEFRDDYDDEHRNEPVAIVLLHDEYSPPSGAYYFRQDAFSLYNGRRMVSATMAGVDDDVATGFPAVSPIEVRNAPSVGAFRSVVETTVGLIAEHPRPFGLESPIRFMPTSNPSTARFARTYRVRSAVLTSDVWGLLDHGLGDPAWAPEVVEHYTRGPADPRYAELAQRIVSDLPAEYRNDPFAQALAITDYLGANGIYSLRSNHTSAEDPTAHFLFGDLTGYCVHFAHAAVYLMRSIGLPSRVSTGYMLPEEARRGGSAMLVTGQWSHAWPEVYVSGVGWVVVDVAPRQALDGAPSVPDEALQQLLAELLRGNNPLPFDGSDAPTPLNEWWNSLKGPLEMGALFVVAFLIVLGYGMKGWRQLAPSLGGEGSRPRLVYRATVDRLASSGIRRNRGESPEAFALRLKKEMPGLVPLTASHLGRSFGTRAQPSASGDLFDHARAVRRGLRKKVPLWRRVLGVLNPYSWLLTR